MELKEMIKVMQHFENGGEVECERQKDNKGKWTLTCSPSWSWIDYKYRIREPKQKVTIEKWLCSDKQGNFVIFETSDIEGYFYYEKVKLLETYEVEL